jgi:hypothetical protein
MLENFPQSLVTSYDLGGHSGYRNPPAGERAQIGTWQG